MVGSLLFAAFVYVHHLMGIPKLFYFEVYQAVAIVSTHLWSLGVHVSLKSFIILACGASTPPLSFTRETSYSFIMAAISEDWT